MSAWEYSLWNDLESGKNIQTNFIALKYKIILILTQGEILAFILIKKSEELKEDW